MEREQATSELLKIFNYIFPSLENEVFASGDYLIENQLFKVKATCKPSTKGSYDKPYKIYTKNPYGLKYLTFDSIREGIEIFPSKISGVTKQNILEIYDVLNENLTEEWFVVTQFGNCECIKHLCHRNYLETLINLGLENYTMKSYCERLRNSAMNIDLNFAFERFKDIYSDYLYDVDSLEFGNNLDRLAYNNMVEVSFNPIKDEYTVFNKITGREYTNEWYPNGEIWFRNFVRETITTDDQLHKFNFKDKVEL